MRAAVALIELHRVPRDVVVDDDGGALEIEALGADVGRDQAIDAPGAKGIDGADGRLQRPAELARRGAKGREDQRWLAGEDVAQSFEFVRRRTEIVQAPHLF